MEIHIENIFFQDLKKNCSIDINGRNFYDQPINDLIKQYDEIKKYQQDKVMITQLIVY